MSMAEHEKNELFSWLRAHGCRDIVLETLDNDEQVSYRYGEYELRAPIKTMLVLTAIARLLKHTQSNGDVREQGNPAGCEPASDRGGTGTSPQPGEHDGSAPAL